MHTEESQPAPVAPEGSATVHPSALLRIGQSSAAGAGSDLYTPRDLLAASTGERSDEFAPALAFCRAWAAGEQSFVFTTSGSTGIPKAITLTRGQMEASARATAAALGLRAGHRSLVCLPTHFIAGRMMLVRGLVLGMEMTLVPPASDPFASLGNPQPAETAFDFAAFDFAAFDFAAFDFAAFVPLQMQTMLEGPVERRRQLDAMHAILVGGAPISPLLERAMATLHAPVYHTYGMTETATHIALRPVNGTQADDAFTPLPGVETTLDVRGCLALRGPMTAGEWIQTNDLVEPGADGRFRWLGRIDLVVNTGGIKVPVEPLEEEIALLPGSIAGDGSTLRRYFVTGLPDERLGEMLVLVLEGAPLSPDLAEEMLRAMRERFGPYRTPRRLLYCARFTETPTRKVDRAASLAQAHA